MTDLFAYHVAKQQMADLRRTSGQTRLTSTAPIPRTLTNGHRVISGVLSRMSTALAIDQRKAGVASSAPPPSGLIPHLPGPTDEGFRNIDGLA
jgi:hypothetical protein